MTTRAQHKSDPIDFEDLQNSYAARKLRKKNIIEQYMCGNTTQKKMQFQEA